MLEKLLGLPAKGSSDLFSYLPVSTSLQRQIESTAEKIYRNHYQEEQKPKVAKKQWEELLPNQDIDNVKNELVMLKLRNLIDHTKFTRGEESRKLPSKMQKGVVVEGDGFEMKRLKRGKRHNSIVDSLLELDQQMGYSGRKFSEVQRIKQKRHRIKKSDVRSKKRYVAK